MREKLTVMVEGVLIDIYSLMPVDIDLDHHLVEFAGVGVTDDGEQWQILGRAEIGQPLELWQWTFGDVFRGEIDVA